MVINDLETPVAIIDLDKVEQNIARVQHYLAEHGIANRPHIKTHKIPAIAKMQVEAGAIGITCQKLGEAEVMADAGIQDIFLPYNILGESKLKRLAALCRRVKMSVTADSETTVRGLSDAMTAEGIDLEVLVEFDTGGHRCGVQTPEEAAALARLIEDSPGLHFGGLMCYPTSDNTDDFVAQTRHLLEADGIEIKQVSAGGSPGLWKAHTRGQITEYRVGTVVYGDRAMIKSGAMTPDQLAMRIICTVVSRPTTDRGILDGGSKTFSSDHAGEGFGLILEYPEAKIYSLNEEHAYVDFSACTNKPVVGERVSVIPNHCCVVSNLFNQIVGVRGDQVEVVWPVAARGLLT
ncbi:MAG: D-TA family PLP-dependent enzyme [Caldilineaceae bacterium]